MYPLRIFVDKVEPDFICSRCTGVLCFPKNIPCGHLFCQACLLPATACVICNKKLNPNCEDNNYVIRKVAALRVKSPLIDKDGNHAVVLGELELRVKALEEVIATEESYGKFMEMMDATYYQPMKKKEIKGLTEEHASLLFGGLERVIQLNQELLEDLKAPLLKAKTVDVLAGIDVGKIFQKHTSEILNTYSVYVSKFGTANTLLNQILDVKNSKYREFRKYHTDCMEQNGDLNLRSLLSMPWQRVLRYKMLLEQVRSYTKPFHPGFEDLEVALTDVSFVATKINEYTRQQESRERFLEVKKKFELEDIGERTLLREGMVNLISRVEPRVTEIQLFLFQDLILYGTLRNQKFAETARFPLDSGAFTFVYKALDPQEREYRVLWQKAAKERPPLIRKPSVTGSSLLLGGVVGDKDRHITKIVKKLKQVATTDEHPEEKMDRSSMLEGYLLARIDDNGRPMVVDKKDREKEAKAGGGETDWGVCYFVLKKTKLLIIYEKKEKHEKDAMPVGVIDLKDGCKLVSEVHVEGRLPGVFAVELAATEFLPARRYYLSTGQINQKDRDLRQEWIETIIQTDEGGCVSLEFEHPDDEEEIAIHYCIGLEVKPLVPREKIKLAIEVKSETERSAWCDAFQLAYDAIPTMQRERNDPAPESGHTLSQPSIDDQPLAVPVPIPPRPARARHFSILQTRRPSIVGKPQVIASQQPVTSPNTPSTTSMSAPALASPSPGSAPSTSSAAPSVSPSQSASSTQSASSAPFVSSSTLSLSTSASAPSTSTSTTATLSAMLGGGGGGAGGTASSSTRAPNPNSSLRVANANASSKASSRRASPNPPPSPLPNSPGAAAAIAASDDSEALALNSFLAPQPQSALQPSAQPKTPKSAPQPSVPQPKTPKSPKPSK